MGYWLQGPRYMCEDTIDFGIIHEENENQHKHIHYFACAMNKQCAAKTQSNLVSDAQNNLHKLIVVVCAWIESFCVNMCWRGSGFSLFLKNEFKNRSLRGNEIIIVCRFSPISTINTHLGGINCITKSRTANKAKQRYYSMANTNKNKQWIWDNKNNEKTKIWISRWRNN